MNKTLISLVSAALLSAGFCATAQNRADAPETANKYLPEQGDFAVGVDLVPLLRTIGGAFNGSDNTPVGGTPFNYDDMYSIRPDVSINGKYMLTDSWGLRLNLGVRLRSTQERAYTTDDVAVYLDPLSEAKVIDSRKTTGSGGSLMFGGEYRLGRRRVQGVFGFGALAGFSTNATSYSYGNTLTSFNRNPSSAYIDDSADAPVALPSGYRITELRTDGPTFAAGVYGSAGAEWFVAPKVSLGAEVNLYFYGTWGSQGYIRSEGYNPAYEKVENRTDIYTPGNRSFNFGTGNIGGALYCTFYF